jgi:hypothetical protein
MAYCARGNATRESNRCGSPPLTITMRND